MISKEETIRHASEIIGVSVESIAELPKEIIGSMSSAMENIDINDGEDKKILYTALEESWEKGSVLVILKELADSTGIAYKTLCSLSFETQKMITFEYMADTSATEHIYELTGKALALIELENISKLINIPVSELRTMDTNVLEKLCGHYSMTYNSSGTNEDLIRELKEMISHE